MKIQNYLFSIGASTPIQSAGILLMRLSLSILMLTHGFMKLSNFDALSSTFPDLLGIGSCTSLVMIIFAEVFCSCLLILGLFSRLATLPLIVGMGVAFFGAHAADPLMVKELPLVYLLMYIVLLILGPGIYSIDALIKRVLK